ncbi:MAG: hypothetical protein ACLQED_00280 [Desulfobaccales bacterium]
MANTTKIDVTLEIYKLIEQNRLSLEEPHYQILSRMLGLPIPTENPFSDGKFYLGEGVYVPHGTLLRVEYKRKEYIAEVRDSGIWVNGTKFLTINKAVNAISDSNQNAWNFWEVKRPQDSKWIPLDNLRTTKTKLRKPARLQVNLTEDDLADFV